MKTKSTTYYPFVLKHRKYNILLSDIQFKPNISNRGLTPIIKGKTYKYKYNGKELQHFQRGKLEICLDTPHLNGKNPTPFNHIHINRGGNKNAFDVFFKPC